MQNAVSCEQNGNGDFVVTYWDGRTETIPKEKAAASPVTVGYRSKESIAGICPKPSGIVYLSNSCGEPVDDLPQGVAPVTPAEEAWLRTLYKEMDLCAHVVELPAGERGVLLAAEIVQPESNDKHDALLARRMGIRKIMSNKRSGIFHG